jgi:hypothetical protein
LYRGLHRACQSFLERFLLAVLVAVFVAVAVNNTFHMPIQERTFAGVVITLSALAIGVHLYRSGNRKEKSYGHPASISQSSKGNTSPNIIGDNNSVH